MSMMPLMAAVCVLMPSSRSLLSDCVSGGWKSACAFSGTWWRTTKGGFEGSELEGQGGPRTRCFGEKSRAWVDTASLGLAGAEHEPVLGVVVLALGRASAAEALGVEAGKHFDPGGAAFGDPLRPGVPPGLLDEPVDDPR